MEWFVPVIVILFIVIVGITLAFIINRQSRTVKERTFMNDDIPQPLVSGGRMKRNVVPLFNKYLMDGLIDEFNYILYYFPELLHKPLNEECLKIMLQTNESTTLDDILRLTDVDEIKVTHFKLLAFVLKYYEYITRRKLPGGVTVMVSSMNITNDFTISEQPSVNSTSDIISAPNVYAFNSEINGFMKRVESIVNSKLVLEHILSTLSKFSPTATVHCLLTDRDTNEMTAPACNMMVINGNSSSIVTDDSSSTIDHQHSSPSLITDDSHHRSFKVNLQFNHNVRQPPHNIAIYNTRNLDNCGNDVINGETAINRCIRIAESNKQKQLIKIYGNPSPTCRYALVPFYNINALNLTASFMEYLEFLGSIWDGCVTTFFPVCFTYEHHVSRREHDAYKIDIHYLKPKNFQRFLDRPPRKTIYIPQFLTLASVILTTEDDKNANIRLNTNREVISIDHHAGFPMEILPKVKITRDYIDIKEVTNEISNFTITYLPIHADSLPQPLTPIFPQYTPLMFSH